MQIGNVRIQVKFNFGHRPLFFFLIVPFLFENWSQSNIPVKIKASWIELIFELVYLFTLKAPTSSTDDALSDMFTEEFSEEMAKQFEDAMKSFMADDPSMLQQIEKMAEAAGSGGNCVDVLIIYLTLLYTHLHICL